MSQAAANMYRLATGLANFDPSELMLEIHRRQRGRDAKANEHTVIEAMQTVKDRHKQ